MNLCYFFSYQFDFHEIYVKQTSKLQTLSQVEPEWKVLEQFVVRRIHDVFTVDSLESSHPIRHNALNADRIAYDKGNGYSVKSKENTL